MFLAMKVAGDNRSGALELVHRMEQSPHFRGAQLVQEQIGGENGAGIAAEIVAGYVPEQAGRSGN
jgi:hypothetical protein